MPQAHCGCKAGLICERTLPFFQGGWKAASLDRAVLQHILEMAKNDNVSPEPREPVKLENRETLSNHSPGRRQSVHCALPSLRLVPYCWSLLTYLLSTGLNRGHIKRKLS